MSAPASTILVDHHVLDQLDELAEVAGRSRAWVIEQAFQFYIEVEGPQIRAIREAPDEYEEEKRLGIVTGIPHEKVMETSGGV